MSYTQPVMRVSDGKIYESVAEAVRDNKCSSNYITKHCKLAYYKKPEWRYGKGER